MRVAGLAVDQGAGGDLDPEEDFDEEVGEDEGGDGVGAEDEPGPEEALGRCGCSLRRRMSMSQ